ncbi:MAG TPA: hypothetical protein VJ827_03440 [Rubrobacter sp.]|nr:hypothetical protein [Rubrobacter sp.]
MMTWLAWAAIALATLVTAVNAWMTWQKLSGASRTPDEPEDPQEQPSLRRSKVAHEPPETFDERGYLYRRRLQGGCEAAICRTPFGARIVAGTRRLEEPQYAWDYASVVQAREAMARISFKIDPEKGIVVEEVGGRTYPAAEPRNYVRRWKYTTGGQMQRF